MASGVDDFLNRVYGSITVMAINELFEVQDVQRFASGEVFLNVYHYAGDGIGAGAEELASAFNSAMVNPIKEIQSNQVKHETISARNLGNPADFYELTLVGAVGLVVADHLAPFTAVNFTLRTASRDVRPGSKRIGGLADTSGAYLNGVFVQPYELNLLEVIRVAMATDITFGGQTFRPVIIKRVKEANGQGGFNYRLPVNDAEDVFYDVVSALVNPRLTHQTSRGNSR